MVRRVNILEWKNVELQERIDALELKVHTVEVGNYSLFDRDMGYGLKICLICVVILVFVMLMHVDSSSKKELYRL